MTEIILSYLVQETLSRVVSLISDEISLAWNLKEDLKGLQESLTMIRAVLQDAEEQQVKRQPVRLWLKKLKDVAYEAEEVLNELCCQNLRRKVELKDQLGRERCNSNIFSMLARSAKKTAFNLKMARKVKNINELLANIKNEAIGFRLQVSSRL